MWEVCFVSFFLSSGRSAFVLLLCASFVGCGETRRAAKVSGIVTLDGKPLGDIGVAFQPAEMQVKKGPMDAVTSAGTSGADGRFELRLSDTNEPGALIGKHTVRFADRLALPAESSDAGPSPAAPKSRLPERYLNGSVEFEVPPEGTDQAVFDLTTK